MTTLHLVAAALPLLSAAAAVLAFTKTGNRTGAFYSLNTPTTGQATLVEAPGICNLELTGLETEPGPALQVWLYEGPAPAPGTDPAVIAAGKHLVLGELKTFSGDFCFAVPTKVRADNYHSVILWCDEVKKFIAAAPLE